MRERQTDPVYQATDPSSGYANVKAYYGDAPAPGRDSLWQRVKQAAHDTDRALDRAQMAKRLLALCEEHPDVVEILDLIERLELR